MEKLANLGKETSSSRNGRDGRRRKDAPDAAYAGEESPPIWQRFGPAQAIARFAEDAREEYARPFSETEATDRESETAEKLQFWAEQFDQFLTISNAQEATCTIWRLDDDEAHILARVWLKRAKKDARAAALLRATLDGSDYIAAAMILGVRSFNTVQWYPHHGGYNLREWRAKQETEQPRPLRPTAEMGPS